jgi:CRISPR/Cas system-associated exonuclease Cas4 (RecB family)
MSIEIWLLIALVVAVIIFLPKGTLIHHEEPVHSPTSIDLSKYGECVWMDKDDAKPFFDGRFRILGKPDAIFKSEDGAFTAIEYKNRSKGIYSSDIVQAKTAALAARGDMSKKHHISKIVVVNQTDYKEVELPANDFELYEDIKYNVEAVQRIKAGGYGYKTKDKYKCQNCGYKSVCDQNRGRV